MTMAIPDATFWQFGSAAIPYVVRSTIGLFGDSYASCFMFFLTHIHSVYVLAALDISSVEHSYSLRSRSHNFELSCMHDDRNFIDRMLFKSYHTV